MPFKTILTIVGPEDDDQDLRTAAALCESQKAHLSVLVTEIAPPPPIGDFQGMIAEPWLQERNAGLARLEKQASIASTFISTSGVSGDVASEYPDVAWAGEVFGRRARYADVTVVGSRVLADDVLKQQVVEGTLFHSGKPVLLAPHNSHPTLSPKRVLVAWDSRVEAARAVREALEILAGAETVHLVIVDPIRDELHHGEEPGADIAAFLARHGAKVEVARLPSENRSVADVLRQHATDMSADLLVMGAYGHSRIRERVFGGVTRSMVEKPSLPIFMAR